MLVFAPAVAAVKPNVDVDVLVKVTKLPDVPFNVTSATNVSPAVTNIDVGLAVFVRVV